MVIGERLAERLKAQGLSQAALARRVGVQQPTINRLIKGGQYGSTQLHRIARVLGTTSAYLTGEVDDPDAVGIPVSELTNDERELVDCYRELNTADRAAVMRIAMSLVGRSPPSGSALHTSGRDYRGDSAR